jgi:hypothetical protein
MNATLAKALAGLVPAGMLLFGSVISFFRMRTAAVLLQLIGAGCLMIVVLTHVCEALQLFPSMGWGLPNSLGHYFDVGGAVLGVTLFPIGYLWQALVGRRKC